MRSIVITGAASGIGCATAKLLVKKGWRVGLFDRNEESVIQLQQSLGEMAQAYRVDVTDEQVFNEALASFVRQGDGLDAIINCAGVLTTGDFESIALDQHQAIVDINTKGVLNGCYLAFPYLKQKSKSCIVNLSSASAVFGVPGFASYSASKFFVRGLTEALYVEWKRYGVKVCDIMPPFANTPMVQKLPQMAIVDRLGVTLEPEDVAKKIVYSLHANGLHHPVSFSFRFMRWCCHWVPDTWLGVIYRKLAEY